MDLNKYSRYFTESAFVEKILKFARKAGASVAYAALLLYYTLTESDMPEKSKMIIIGALGYFILPIDLIPDLIPVAGFTDDLSALVLAIITVTKHITPEVKEKARAKLATWFTEAEIDDAVSGVNDKINAGKK